MEPVTLVVMAAGAGSRFGGPKQLTPAGPAGETLLEYTVHDALRLGVERVVLVVRREAIEAFRASIGARLAGRVEVAYAVQSLDDLPAGVPTPAPRAKPWGTGHAVLAARDAVGGPFVLANGDDVSGAAALAAVVDFLRGARHGWALATWSLPGLAFAVWTVANLVPRARANHRWYRGRFPDYPKERRALVPGVW